MPGACPLYSAFGGARHQVGIVAPRQSKVHSARDTLTGIPCYVPLLFLSKRDPLPLGVVSTTLAASTDFGNVSYRLPGMHPLIRIAPADVALHTREFTAESTSHAARSAATDGAYGLAATLLDVLHDPALAAAVAEEFAQAGGAIDVPSFFD